MSIDIKTARLTHKNIYINVLEDLLDTWEEWDTGYEQQNDLHNELTEEGIIHTWDGEYVTHIEGRM